MKHETIIFITVIFIISGSLPAKAQITHDQSLGATGKLHLSGPDYEIRAKYGRQAGSNLFHSFEQFNIHSGESATFTGPDTVRNIVSRVTGGSASWIDGKLASAIPDADLYLLNPSGVMFGPDASLDMDGSFHVSTADYLRMGKNGRFSASPLEKDVLSVASPAAFGFLDGDIAPISVEGKGHIPPEEWDGFYSRGLVVARDRGLSLIGGNIELKKGSTTTIEDETTPVGTLLIPEKGELSIVSAASPGEVILRDSGPDVSSFSHMGDISISDNSAIHAGGGKIFVRGGSFVLDDVTISAGQLILPGLDEPEGGNNGLIDIQTNSLRMMNDSDIMLQTFGAGGAGSLNIRASDAVFFSDSNITSGSYAEDESSGDAGSVEIQAKTLSFTENSEIDSSTWGGGRGGDVTIRAQESVSFSGEGIVTGSRGQGEHSGVAGNISIETGSLSLTNGAFLISNTWGEGKGGEVSIQASDAVTFSGTNDEGRASKIYTFSYGSGENAGDSGDISIEAGSVSFRHGGGINASTTGSGNAGNIRISASGAVEFDGVNPHGENAGGFSSGISAPSDRESGDAGKAGDILIEAETLSLTRGASLANSTSGSGKGGYIFIKTDESVHISGDQRDAEQKEALESQLAFQKIVPQSDERQYASGIYSRSEGKNENAGDAGWIRVVTPELRVSDKGRISASSFGKGDGGFVRLEISDLEIGGKASVSSTSQADGNAGTILIVRDMETDENGFMVDLIPAETIRIMDNASVNASSQGKGNAGAITMNASRIELDSNASVASSSKNSTGGDAGLIAVIAEEHIVMGDETRISTSTDGEGDGGLIALDAPRADLDNARISSASKSENGGDGGMIAMNVHSLRMRNGAGISTSSKGNGDAGGIGLQVSRLDLEGGSSISSANLFRDGNGDAGMVLIGRRIALEREGEKFDDLQSIVSIVFPGGEIISSPDDDNVFSVTRAAEHIAITDKSNVSTSVSGRGHAGDIVLGAERFEMDGEAFISSESSSSDRGGNAGTVRLSTGEFHLRGNSSVSTGAKDAGGGDMEISAEKMFYLSEGQIRTSVQGGDGNGGNIRIARPQYAVLNHSQIRANAYEGKGGNIHIDAGEFVQSSDSSVEASSEKGIDGSIMIESPDTDIVSGLVMLPGNYIDAVRWAKTPCHLRSGEHFSRFLINGRDAVAQTFNDWRPSPLYLPDSSDQ